MTNALLWSQLQDRVRDGLAELPGVAGFHLQDLATRDTMGWHEQEVFPVASTIKIPVLVGLLARAERGEVDLQERIAITPEVLTPGSGVLTYLEGPLDLSVLDIAQLMIMVSDNTATNLCIDWADMDATNELMDSLGLSHTRVRRKMQDHESVARNEENTSTPAEAVALMRALYESRPSPAVAEQALAILKKPNRGPIERAMEPGVPVSNKPGGMERVRCDAGIVWLQRHPYALAIMSKFGMGHALRQENCLVAAVQLIHEYMVAIDRSSALGQGIPSSLLDG